MIKVLEQVMIKRGELMDGQVDVWVGEEGRGGG